MRVSFWAEIHKKTAAPCTICCWTHSALNFIFLHFLGLSNYQNQKITAICLLPAWLNFTSKRLTKDVLCSWAFGLSMSLNFLPSITYLPFLEWIKPRNFWKKCMAVPRCAELRSYYSKLRKRRNMSLRARNPRSFTVSPGFQKQKIALSRLHKPGLLVWESPLETCFRTFHASGFLGSLDSVLLHSTRICELPKTTIDCWMCPAGRADLFYQKTVWKGLCFWILGLISFCSLLSCSPLRITTKAPRLSNVYVRLNQKLLSETIERFFDASGVLGFLSSILLQYTRLSKSTKSYHCVPMRGSVETEQKNSRMKTCSQILPFS